MTTREMRNAKRTRPGQKPTPVRYNKEEALIKDVHERRSYYHGKCMMYVDDIVSAVRRLGMAQ